MKQPLSEQTLALEIPRRRFLRDAATLATAACVSPQLLIGCQPGVIIHWMLARSNPLT